MGLAAEGKEEGGGPAVEEDLKLVRRFCAEDLRRMAGRWPLPSGMGAMDMTGVKDDMDVVDGVRRALRGNPAAAVSDGREEEAGVCGGTSSTPPGLLPALGIGRRAVSNPLTRSLFTRTKRAIDLHLLGKIPAAYQPGAI